MLSAGKRPSRPNLISLAERNGFVPDRSGALPLIGSRNLTMIAWAEREAGAKYKMILFLIRIRLN
jgi:hypothetical protein